MNVPLFTYGVDVLGRPRVFKPILSGPTAYNVTGCGGKSTQLSWCAWLAEIMMLIAIHACACIATHSQALLGAQGNMTLELAFSTNKWDNVHGPEFGCKVGVTYHFQDPDEAADQMTFPGCTWYVWGPCILHATRHDTPPIATFGSRARPMD